MYNYIISIILGIITSYILSIILFKKHILHGPNSSTIVKQTFEKNGKCYKLIPVIKICPLSIY